MILLIFQMSICCMIPLVMALGLMAGLSGGGGTPSFQRIGQLLLVPAPLAGVVAVVVSLVLQQVGLASAAYAILAVPVLLWAGLVLWLQRATGFFS